MLEPQVKTIGTYSSVATYATYEVDKLSRPTNLSGSKDNRLFVASTPSGPDATISIAFDDQAGLYTMTLPDGHSGNLVLAGLNGSVGQFASSTSWTLSANSGPQAQVTMPTPFRPGYPYTYSHYGRWTSSKDNQDGTADQTWGWFVYGYVPNADAIPKSGTARYHANILADSPVDPFEITGTVELDFDFGASKLTGSMHPVHETNGWYPAYDYDYGIYDFAQTVYGAGSTNYSGTFAKNGQLVSGSWFDGSLTGPYANEVIGRFAAPFQRNGSDGTLTGIWIGAKN